MKFVKRFLLPLVLFTVLISASSAFGTPTQEDVFKSISENMDQKSDSGHFLAYLMGIAGVVILCVFFSRRRQRETSPRVLNHNGKLLKEIMRGIHLRPAEMRQLRSLAETQSLENALTLLLCPSVLEKAVKERPGKVERKIMLQLSRKLGMTGGKAKG